jgi:hypothetical protein
MMIVVVNLRSFGSELWRMSARSLARSLLLLLRPADDCSWLDLLSLSPCLLP